MTAPKVRLLGPEDAEAFCALRREALEDAPLAFLSSPEQDAGLDPDVARERLAANADAKVFAAIDADGSPCGMMGVRREDALKARHKAIVWGAWVRPGARGAGVGAALVEAAIEAARGMEGVDWLHLSVASTAVTARRLYERAGFEAWGTEPDALRAGGGSASETHMALDLSETNPEALLSFWFGACEHSAEAFGERVRLWFGGSAELDRALARRFAHLPELAMSGELAAWEEAPRSAVALVIALDQLPRNLRRGSGEAFACDARAAEVAERAIARGFDERVSPALAAFLYLPFEHAEDLALQDRSVACFERLVPRASEALRPQFSDFVGYAERHRAVITRFGRFPHRNGPLGREATAEEEAWLAAGGDDFSGSHLEEEG